LTSHRRLSTKHAAPSRHRSPTFCKLTSSALSFSQEDTRTYVCLEVLEHLDDDCDLIGKLPAGARLILSVPSFESDTHVRWFDSFDDVTGRYDGLLDFTETVVLPVGDEGRVIYLADTVRW